MKNKRVIGLVLLLSLSVCFNNQVLSNENNTAKLKADRVRYKKEENLRIATGNVSLAYKENYVSADKLKMNSETNLLTFSSAVKVKRPQETIESDYLEFNLEADQLIAKKNVVLNTTNNDKKLYLTSQYLKLWTDTDDMLAKQNVYMEYDEQQIRGGNLDYKAQKEKMIVTEEAEIRENEEWIKSKRIIIDLKNDNIDAQGKVEMEFEVNEESDS